MPAAGQVAPLLAAVGVWKRFPTVVANAGVNLEIFPREVHALLGENGSGKTTLCKMLTGLYRPDAGELLVEGRQVSFRSPRAAYEAGIFLVQQHFSLVDRLTVTENIVVGLKDRGWWMNRANLAVEIRAAAEHYQLDVDPDRYIWQLSVGERQRVEILKALFRGARILLLDEPTSVLTPQESEQLFVGLRELAAQGTATVFISHKLKEVLSVADRITVLRHGKTVATVRARDEDLSAGQLARLMVGREVVPSVRSDEPPSGDIVLVLDAVSSLNEYRREVIRSVSLTVRAGEIVGVVGVAGNGQRQLAEVITGLRARSAGSIRVGARELLNASPADAIAAGIAYVPEDRFGTGLVPDLSIADNLVLKSYASSAFSRLGMMRPRAVTSWSESRISKFSIKGHRQSLARELSGGNAQKVVLARELSSEPHVVVAAAPTRGLDVAATEAVRRLLLDASAGEAAVLLISEDLDEVLELADRIAVMYRGAIVGTLGRDEFDRDQIGLMMAGLVDDDSDATPTDESSDG